MGAVEQLERQSRLRIALGAAVVLVLVGLGCAVLFSALAPTGSSTVVEPTSVTTVAPAGIFVHVLGEVATPGLYELAEGDRAVDAIAAAGGFTPKADQAQLNLARFVTDGEQIIVPRVGETPQAPGGASVPGKVNLNTADAATLETLPRIGPAMAERILTWRETNGRFSAVEDLMSVSGVGDKTFEALKSLVTV
jgi:competence protein ComEA